MISITVTEFRSNLSKYLKELADGAEVIVGDIKLISPDAELPTTQSASVAPVLDMECLDEMLGHLRHIRDYVDKRPSQVRPAPVAASVPSVGAHNLKPLIHCTMCRRNRPNVYEVWADGEEKPTCLSCMESRVGPKLIAAEVAKWTKLN